MAATLGRFNKFKWVYWFGGTVAEVSSSRLAASKEV